MKKILLILTMTLMLCINAFAQDDAQHFVTASGLNIRTEPNTNSQILCVVKRGTVLRVENVSNGWATITWNGDHAFVCAKYIASATAPSIQNKEYSQEDLDLLARVINAEAGSSWLTDEHQLAVGSVVLNRVADNRFPNTIRGVVYQRGQYACTWNGAIDKQPSERATLNATRLLESGATIPANVVWQAQFKQGNGVWKYIQGHYFCY